MNQTPTFENAALSSKARIDREEAGMTGWGGWKNIC